LRRFFECVLKGDDLGKLEVKQYSKVRRDPDGTEAGRELFCSIRVPGKGGPTIDLRLSDANSPDELKKAREELNAVVGHMRNTKEDLFRGNNVNLQGQIWKEIMNQGIGIARLQDVNFKGDGAPLKGKYGSGNITGLNLKNTELIGNCSITNCYGSGVNRTNTKTAKGATLTITGNRLSFLDANGLDLQESKGSSIVHNEFDHGRLEEISLGSTKFRKNFNYVISSTNPQPFLEIEI